MHVLFLCLEKGITQGKHRDNYKNTLYWSTKTIKMDIIMYPWSSTLRMLNQGGHCRHPNFFDKYSRLDVQSLYARLLIKQSSVKKIITKRSGCVYHTRPDLWHVHNHRNKYMNVYIVNVHIFGTFVIVEISSRMRTSYTSANYYAW